jgi:hypothetical protein
MNDQQPPPDDDRAQPEPDSDTAEQPMFRQELLPQQVQPAPRRTGLIVAVGVVVLLVAVGVVVWSLSSDDGGGDRDAYCETLRTATNDGDLAGALGSTDPTVVDQLADESPDDIREDWQRLVKLRDMFTDGGEPSTAEALAAVTALQNIVEDANSECGITLDLPLP